MIKIQTYALWVLISGLLAFRAVAAPSEYVFGEYNRPGLRVGSEHPYTPERGFGFESVSGVNSTSGEGAFYFSVDVAPGNYRIDVEIGHPKRRAVTTVKSELRRLQIENASTDAGQYRIVSFVVNVRTPQITAVPGVEPGQVKLKVPRETTDEAWNWDSRLTLEFGGEGASVVALRLEPVKVPTLFLLGDSTVADQSKEPYASWGQMLPRFFGPTVAVANHAESGETYRDAWSRRRVDKILSCIQPGDTFLVQFGHNDQKQIAKGQGGPFTTYKEEMRKCVQAVKARGASVVLVSSMERRGFAADGTVKPSLQDYAEAVRQVAKEEGVPMIDLNALSKPLYQALEADGPEMSRRAFALQDNTHHNNYGAYQLAKCIAQALRSGGLPVADHLASDFGGYNPSRPDPVAEFRVPPSPVVTEKRPLGD